MGSNAESSVRKRALMDSSSAILLYKTSLLEKTFSQYYVIMAKSVFEEVTCKGHAGSDYMVSYRNMKLITLEHCNYRNAVHLADKEASSTLGRGERDSIELYLQGRGDFIILDDGKGAALCKKRSIPYINALLVPRILHIARLITDEELKRRSANIIACGRYSRAIIEYALTCPDERLLQFV